MYVHLLTACGNQYLDGTEGPLCSNRPKCFEQALLYSGQTHTQRHHTLGSQRAGGHAFYFLGVLTIERSQRALHSLALSWGAAQAERALKPL